MIKSIKDKLKEWGIACLIYLGAFFNYMSTNLPCVLWILALTLIVMINYLVFAKITA
jgi:hypothetical protein